MKRLPKSTPQFILGLLLATLCAGLLGHQFGRSALSQQLDSQAKRQATIIARSLAHLVEGQLDSASASDKQALPRLVESWQSAWQGRVRDIRVLKLGGAMMLATTRDGEEANKRLDRKNTEHKAFYDLGSALRSGISTNADEGVFRKEEISLERHPQQGLVVTVPLYNKDKFFGISQVVVTPNVDRVEFPLKWTFAMIIGVTLLGLVFGFLLGQEERHFLRVAIGAAILIAAVVGYSIYTIDDLKSGRHAIEGDIAKQYMFALDTNRDAAALAEMDHYELPTENSWDSDIYRRPHHFFDGIGQLNLTAIQDDLNDNSKRLGNALRGNGLLALGIYLFFALGLGLKLWRTIVEYRSAYAYVTPAMAGMMLLVFFPFLYGIALSFTGQTLYNTDQSLLDIWVGFENYVEILSDVQVLKSTSDGWVINYDNFYWTAFITIMWTVCNVFIGVSVGLGLALCLNVPGMKFKPIYRAILVLPWAIPSYVTALIWKGLFHKQFGPINQMIQLFGGEPIAWFDSVFSAFLTGIIVNGWLSFPFMMLISLGGLQSISADMYEAARLDGATKFQQFRFITLPSLKPTLVPAVIISVVWTFNLFNVIYLVSGGEPGGANEILVTQAYKIAFEKYQYGYAAAYSTVIFLILLVYGVFQNKMSNATEDIHK